MIFTANFLTGSGGEPPEKLLATNRVGGVMTLSERRFPNRLNVSDPRKSYLWFIGVILHFIIPAKDSRKMCRLEP